MAQELRKRKSINLGIKTQLQLKYLKLIIGVVIIILVVVGATFYGTFRIALDTAQLGRYAEARINEIFVRLDTLLFVEAVVFVLIAGFLSLKLTHRIAGPMMRIESMLRQMSETNVLEEIKIRKDDELQDLVKEINSLIAKFGKKQP